MNLPTQFVEQIRSLLGDEEARQLEEALSGESPVSVRVNRAKDPLCASVPSVAKVPWTEDGYYLDQRPSFTFDPLFHAGLYYVQEASSMFVEQAVRQYVDRPVMALDLCAAPGGKSTHLRSLLPEGSLLVANEVIRSRSQILAENLIKWGHPEVIVANNDPADFSSLPELFDVILTDVPCSGEGMFRKAPASVDEWSPDNVNICYQRQRRIVADIWPCLKPGGILIYSTCTYNIKEDEDNIAWMLEELGAEALPLSLRPEWNITGNLSGKDFPVYRFLPHKTRGEGFFLAVMRKPADDEGAFSSKALPSRKPKKKKGEAGKPPVFPREVKTWLTAPDDYLFEINHQVVTAFPRRHSDVWVQMSGSLRIVHAGISLGEVKGKDIIPHHSLAMSSCLNSEQFPRVEVDYDMAISYLRKEAVVLPADAPRGFVLLTYKGHSLGFVKNIGNRANNLYPNEWRVRS